jgi:hypothetical protein
MQLTRSRSAKARTIGPGASLKENQMSAAPRSIQSSTSSSRQLGVALLAVVLAAVLVIGLAYAQLSASKATIAPAAGAPVTFDHGWSSAPSKTKPAITPTTFDHGTSTPSFSKAHSERPSSSRGSRGMDRARFAQ